MLPRKAAVPATWQKAPQLTGSLEFPRKRRAAPLRERSSQGVVPFGGALQCITRGPTFCWIGPARKRLNPSISNLVAPAGAQAIPIHVPLLRGAIDLKRRSTSPSADQSPGGEGQERSLRATHNAAWLQRVNEPSDQQQHRRQTLLSASGQW